MINKTMQHDVHVNLNIGGLSTKYISGKKYGRLYKHAQTAIIKDAVMRIQSGGHSRCISQGVRNVHAFVRGETMLDTNVLPILCSRHFEIVLYNPFEADHFFLAETNIKVTGAKIVVLKDKEMFAFKPY